MLLNAYHQGLLSLKEIVRLTSVRAHEIFTLPDFNDWVLVDLNKSMTISNTMTASKCGFTPYAGLTLQGWPVHTILNGKWFDI
jgi:dihydroorotase